jgi:ubiquinol-cytochrome c reductase cytochrome c1 subunit
MRRLILALAAFCALGAVPALAAEEAEHAEDYAFSFDGPLGNYDMASVQRGFAVYKQVCASCHSMNHLAYRHLGEEGGPFAAYRVRNHETGEEAVQIGLHPGQHGTFIPVTENAFVRAIADDVQILDMDPNDGQMVERAGRPSDHFRAPFANETAARAANGGAYPPDLSEITLARHGGADYIRALLVGYTGEEESGKYINRFFPGQLIAMPPPLADGIVTYDDGTPSTAVQMATDVTTFLQWAADPHMVARKSTGLQVLAFLVLLSGLLYLTYKHVWRGESH